MKRTGIGFSITTIHLRKNTAKTVSSGTRAGIVMVAEGAAKAAGEEACILSLDEYYILPPGGRCAFTNRDETVCVLWVLMIDQALLLSLQAPGEDLWDGFCSLKRHYMSAMNRSNMIMREMFQNIFTNRISLFEDTYARMHVGFCAVVSLRACLAQPAPEKPMLQPPLTMTDIYQYVRGHLSGDLSLEAIAKALHFSPGYLSHTFREHAGISLHQYVLSRRLNYVNVLLRQGVSVVSAAERCGFGSAVSLIRAYRQRFGITPGEAAKGFRKTGATGVRAGE